ncbi:MULTISPECIES: hypothetical protein [Streptomyces]|uniref:hypothetical protein n=1 Tax=Streptomyces scabiei TaxID=1930 RepID=UPI001B33750C|nr:hypothetical protein [Streptomyces sp. LBUM 1487]MBP5888748.1 hypothetical protein [Streptomyces sp. LBUM 1487]
MARTGEGNGPAPLRCCRPRPSAHDQHGTVEEGWSGPADIQYALDNWLQCAARLGATAQDLDDAVEAVRTALAERENEVRLRDAVRTDVLDQVAEAIDFDPDSAPW